MPSSLSISRASLTSQRAVASAASRRRVGPQASGAARRTPRHAPAAPISVPVALAQPGIHAVSSNAVAVQEWAQTAQTDVVSHRRSVAAYPSLSANAQILAPGLVTTAHFISIDVRA